MAKTKTIREIEYGEHALNRWKERLGLSEDQLKHQLKICRKRSLKNGASTKGGRRNYRNERFYNFRITGADGNEFQVCIPVSISRNTAFAKTVIANKVYNRGSTRFFG